MGFGDIAKLLASLDLDTKPFERSSRRVDSGLGNMERGLGRTSTKALALGTAVGTGIERLAERGISFLFGQIRQGEESLRVLQDAMAQTDAVIESTGGKAGVSAQQVRDLAESIESLTTADDKAVQQGENLLLTFTNIGGKIFPDATKAMVNMAIALNKGNAETADFDGAAIQLGKALNDPIKGITALSRVGVSFTAQQEKQIKHLVESGDLMGAQKVILGELTTEFGKAGEAAGKSGASGVRRLSDAVDDAQLSLAQGLAPALEDIRDELAASLSDPGTQADLRHLGEFLGDAAKKGLAFAQSVPWGQVADGLKTAAGFAGKLIDGFANLPPGVQGTLLALAGLSKLGGGGVIKVGVSLLGEGIKGLLGQFTSRGSPANPMFVVAEGGGLGGAGIPGAKGGIGALGKMFLVGEAIGLVTAVEGVRESISAGLVAQTNDIHQNVSNQINATKPDIASLAQSMAAVESGINDISSNPLNVLVGGEALTQLEQMRTELGTALKEQDDTVKSNFRQSERDDASHTTTTKQAIDRSRDATEAARIAIASKVQQTSAKVGDLARAENTQTSKIVGAIARNRPIVNLSVRVSGDTVRVTKNYQSGSNIGRPGGPKTGGQQEF